MSPATTQYQDAAMMINCALIPVLVVWESIIVWTPYRRACGPTRSEKRRPGWADASLMQGIASECSEICGRFGRELASSRQSV